MIPWGIPAGMPHTFVLLTTWLPLVKSRLSTNLSTRAQTQTCLFEKRAVVVLSGVRSAEDSLPLF